MDIIILSGKAKQSLTGLTAGKSIGALQLVNQPVVNFMQDAILNQLKVSHFQVLAPSRHTALVSTVNPNLDWLVSVQEYAYRLEKQADEVLWLRDDVLYDVDFTRLLKHARQSVHHAMVFFSGGNPVMFYQKHHGGIDLRCVFSARMTTHDVCQNLLSECSWHGDNFIADMAYVIDSVESYYRVSMKLLSGDLLYTVLDYHQAGNSLIKGKRVNIKPSSLKQDHAYLGDSVYVHPRSLLHNQAILCQHSYIDSYVDIRDSIIMPWVYIGSYLNIKNSVVTQEAVIRVDTGDVIPIVDKKMVGDILSQ